MNNHTSISQFGSAAQETQTSQFQQIQMNIEAAQNLKRLTKMISCHLKSTEWKKVNEKSKQLYNINSQQFLPQYKILAIQLCEAWKQNKSQVFLLEIIDYFINKIADRKDRDQLREVITDISVGVLICTVDMQIQEQRKLLQIWKAYIEILRSYCFLNSKWQLDQNDWYYFDMFTIMLLPNLHRNSLHQLSLSNHVKRGKQVYNLVLKLMAQQFQVCFLITSQLFHDIFLFFKIFANDIQIFMKRNNSMLNLVQQINSCTLMMKIIINRFEGKNTEVGNRNYINKNSVLDKLDCVVFLISMLENKLPPSENSKQLLQFMLFIVLYSIQEEGKQTLELMKKNLELNIYAGQLFAMVCFRNINIVIKECRQTKIVLKMCSFFKVVYLFIMKQNRSIENMQIMMKRMILGLYGIMKIRVMETRIQELIRQLFPLMIEQVERQNGYQNEECQLVGQNQKQQVVLRLGNWSQQFGIKHKLNFIEDIDEIDELKQAVLSIKDNNLELFSQLMQSFDEHSMIMWIVQLQEQEKQQQKQ